MKNIPTLGSLLKASLVVFDVIALHLLAYGVYYGLQRVMALFGGALILSLIAFTKVTAETIGNTIKFYFVTGFILNTCLLAGGLGLGAVRLIVSALADNREGIREATQVLQISAWKCFLIYFVLGFIANFFPSSDVPTRKPWRHKTAAEVQGAILDRLAEQWRKGQ